MEIGKAIRELRIDRGIKQRDLAFRSRITPTYLSLIERREHKPSFKALKNIADALEVNVGEIVLTALDPKLLEDPEYGAAVQLIIEPIVKYFARPE